VGLCARLTDGSTWWQVRPLQDSLDVLGLVLSGDTLYVGGKQRLVPDTLSFYGFGNAVVLALDRRTGRLLARWNDRQAVGESNVNWPPLLTDSLLIFGQALGDGVIALDRRTLRQVWRAPVEATRIIGVTSAIVRVGDTVYGASNTHLMATHVRTGQVLWRDPFRSGTRMTLCNGQIVSGGSSLIRSAPSRFPPTLYMVGDETRFPDPSLDTDGQRVFAQGRDGLTASPCSPP
jgi:outer membrane protein assembly factor BamB